MKKNYRLTLLLLFALIGISFAQTDPLTDFANQINTKWKDGPDTDIIALVNARLQTSPQDVLALSIKQYYFVFVTRDPAQARQAADQLVSAVQSYNNPEANAIAQNMKDEIYEIPLSDAGSYSQQQKDVLKSEFDKMPFSDICLRLAKKVTASPPSP